MIVSSCHKVQYSFAIIALCLNMKVNDLARLRQYDNIC